MRGLRTEMGKVLIIDTNEKFAREPAGSFREKGHDSYSAMSASEGLGLWGGGAWDVVFINDRMPDGDSLWLLPKFLECPKSPEVIIISDTGA